MRQYLRCLRNVWRGLTPVFLDYKTNFTPRWTDNEGNPFLQGIIQGANPGFETNLASLQQFEPVVRAILDGQLSPAIEWKNAYIPALDGFSIMSAAANAKSKFLEIGSGNSTIFARHAIKALNKPVRLISIDPNPRVEINALCDTVIRKPLEEVDLSFFDQLEPGDALFCDNSHRSFMNSDVTVFMCDILPRLKSGVLVGIHDIFLPHDYPAAWSQRAYNEQYLLACILLANPGYFDLKFCNYWITMQGMHVEPLKDIWDLLGPEVRDRRASAFWGVKR